MTDKLMDYITNPVKCKLFLEIHAQGKTTAKYLAHIYNDIPQATLYRHLKQMLSDGILQVIEGTQVRGTVEKTYALAFNINNNMETARTKFRRTLYAVFHAVYIRFCKAVSRILSITQYKYQKRYDGLFSFSAVSF